MDCLFCGIVAGNIPSHKIYEDDSLIAILDIKPVNRGHMLIIPKEHHATVLDTPAHLLTDIMSAVPGLARAVLKATGATGFNLLVNTSRDAGQLVDHVHAHVIPRLDGDGYKHWVGKPYANDADAATVANAIRLALQ